MQTLQKKQLFQLLEATHEKEIPQVSVKVMYLNLHIPYFRSIIL